MGERQKRQGIGFGTKKKYLVGGRKRIQKPIRVAPDQVNPRWLALPLYLRPYRRVENHDNTAALGHSAPAGIRKRQNYE
jgi:hypothetical protein